MISGQRATDATGSFRGANHCNGFGGEHRVQRWPAMAEEISLPISWRGVATHIG